MSKTSCIIRIENDRFINIRESYKYICDKNECAAALLNFLENRNNAKEAEIEEKAQHRNFKPDIMDYAIQASDKFLSEFALLGHYGRNSIRNAKELLFGKDFIKILREKGKNDFLVLRPDTINNALLEYKNLADRGVLNSTGNLSQKGQPPILKRTTTYPKKDNHLSQKGQVTYPKKDTYIKDTIKDNSRIVQVQFKEPFELEPNRTEPFLKENDFEQNELRTEPNELSHPGGAAKSDNPITHDDMNQDDLFFLQRFANVAAFKSAFLAENPSFENLDFSHYFEKAKSWSEKKQVRRQFWISTVLKFVENDKAEGKMKIKKTTEGVNAIEISDSELKNLILNFHAQVAEPQTDDFLKYKPTYCKFVDFLKEADKRNILTEKQKIGFPIFAEKINVGGEVKKYFLSRLEKMQVHEN
jgi:hypothetical protein